MELEKLQAQLKSQIQEHQVVVQQIKSDPKNPDLQKKLRSLQVNITSLSEQQNHVVQQLRQELLKSSGVKILPKTESSSNGDQLISSKGFRVKVKQEPRENDPDYHPSILRPVLSQNLPNLKPKPSPVVIMSTQSGNGTLLCRSPTSPFNKSPLQSPNMNVISLNNHLPSGSTTIVPSSRMSGRSYTTHFPTILPRPPHMMQVKLEPAKPVEPQKLEFMAALGLITPQALIDIQAKRQERKRRSTCMSPQNAFEVEPEPKRANKLLMLPNMKRGRGRPPKFQTNSAPGSPKAASPLANGFGDTGKPKRFRYRRFISADFPMDEDDDHDDVCCECKASGELLMCDTCILVYHLSCLDPPLTTVPTGMWICPKCKETASKSDSMPWPGMLAVVRSYMAHKTAKEEEKNSLLKRSEELRAERLELETKAKSLSNSIMEQMQTKSTLSASNKTAKKSVDKLIQFIELVQSL